MKSTLLLVRMGLVAVMALCISLPVSAIAYDGMDSSAESHPSGQFATLDSPDTLRTNLWLAEALMGEIVLRTVQVLPPAPARILLLPGSDSVLDEMYNSVAFGILIDQGYDLYVENADSSSVGSYDVHYDFRVNSVELYYPETHRTLGLWKRWISRELNASVNVKISLEETGQLLLSQKITRSFSDRVEADDFDSVESKFYEFTTAEISESGWHSRIEEIVVLGTLAGLIAIYFSNTGN